MSITFLDEAPSQNKGITFLDESSGVNPNPSVPLTQKTRDAAGGGKPEDGGFLSDLSLAGKVIGTGVYSAFADMFPKILAEAIRAGDIDTDTANTALDRWIQEQKKDLERWDLTEAEKNDKLFGIIKAQDVLSGLQNLGYSAAIGVAGMVGGAAIGSLAGPAGTVAGTIGGIAGGVAGAGAITFPVMYRATKDQFLADMLDKAQREKPDLTDAEWNEMKVALESDAQMYAFWEAAPETVGNMITAGIIKTPIGSILKRIPDIKNIISRTLATAGTKIALDIPEELATETLTQYQQAKIEAKPEVGLRDKAPTIKEAFTEIAPQVLVTTIAGLGMGSVASRASEVRQEINFHQRLSKLGYEPKVIRDLSSKIGFDESALRLAEQNAPVVAEAINNNMLPSTIGEMKGSLLPSLVLTTYNNASDNGANPTAGRAAVEELVRSDNYKRFQKLLRQARVDQSAKKKGGKDAEGTRGQAEERGKETRVREEEGRSVYLRYNAENRLEATEGTTSDLERETREAKEAEELAVSSSIPTTKVKKGQQPITTKGIRAGTLPQVEPAIMQAIQKDEAVNRIGLAKPPPVRPIGEAKFATTAEEATPAVTSFIENIAGQGRTLPVSEKRPDADAVILTGVRVDLAPDGNRVRIIDMKAFEPGQGDLVNLMRMLRETARDTNVDLVVTPAGDSAAQKSAVTTWYGENGFIPEPNGDMIFTPTTTEPQEAQKQAFMARAKKRIRLVAEARPAARSYAFSRFTNSPMSEKEIEDESDKALAKAVATFDIDKPNFTSWMKTVVSQSLQNYIDKVNNAAKREPSTVSFQTPVRVGATAEGEAVEVSKDVSEIVMEKGNPRDIVMSNEFWEDWKRLLGVWGLEGLSETRRKVMVRHLEGMNHATIARELGFDQTKVEREYAGATKQFKEFLDNHGFVEAEAQQVLAEVRTRDVFYGGLKDDTARPTEQPTKQPSKRPSEQPSGRTVPRGGQPVQRVGEPSVAGETEEQRRQNRSDILRTGWNALRRLRRRASAKGNTGWDAPVVDLIRGAEPVFKDLSNRAVEITDIFAQEGYTAVFIHNPLVRISAVTMADEKVVVFNQRTIDSSHELFHVKINKGDAGAMAILKFVRDEWGVSNDMFTKYRLGMAKSLRTDIANISRERVEEDIAADYYQATIDNRLFSRNNVEFFGMVTIDRLAGYPETTLPPYITEGETGEIKSSPPAPNAFQDGKDAQEITRKYGDATGSIEDIKYAVNNKYTMKSFPIPVGQLATLDELGKPLSNVFSAEAQILNQLFPNLFKGDPSKLSIIDSINVIRKAKANGDLADFMTGKRISDNSIISWSGTQASNTIRKVEASSFRRMKPNELTGTGGFWTKNIKTGLSLDFALSSCVPTAACPRCYAASVIQSHTFQQVNYFRNLLWAIHDPNAFADASLKELKGIHSSMTKESLASLGGMHIRFNAFGDIGFKEQVQAMNRIIEGMPQDTIAVIFSRNHTARWKGQGALDQIVVPKGKNVIINASVDRQLVREYGISALKKLPKNWNISYLYVGEEDINVLRKLLNADLFPIIHIDKDDYNNDSIRTSLKKAYVDTGYEANTDTATVCPCSVRFQPQASSCVQCQKGTHGCFRMTRVAVNNKLVRGAALARVMVSLKKTRDELKVDKKGKQKTSPIRLWDGALVKPLSIIERNPKNIGRAEKYIEHLGRTVEQLQTEKPQAVAKATEIVSGKIQPTVKFAVEESQLADGSIIMEQPKFAVTSMPIEEAKNDESVFWHGSPSGDLRGSANGLHIGTYTAAKQALEARIGVPAVGEWDGTREYGKTLIAGNKTLKKIDPRGYNQTGFNIEAPEEDYYPTGKAEYSDRTPVAMTATPSLRAFRITGKMSNTPQNALEDFKANAVMRGQITRGMARRGYFYENVGEDEGSISAVIPASSHIEEISLTEEPKTAVTSTEDQVYYHGTQSEFAEFSDKITNINAYGKGFYFTTDRQSAERYAKAEEGGRIRTIRGERPRVISARLEIKKPFVMGQGLVSNEDLATINSIAGWELGPFDESYKPTANAVWSELVINSTGDKATTANQILQKAGFDAIVAPKETIVFKRERILGQQSEDVKFATRAVTPAEDQAYMDAVEKGDTATAQRMVDEAAKKAWYDSEPVYHGSPHAGFTKFDIPSKGYNSNVLGSWDVERNVAFFTPDKNAAAGYQTQGGRTSGETRKFYLDGEFADLRKGISEARLNTLVDNGVNERFLSQKGASWELFDKEQDPDGTIVKAFKKMGYDGVIIHDTDGINDFDSYAVFSPSRIKSADPVTRDDAGNVIPLSKRFDPKKEDIRYAVEDDAMVDEMVPPEDIEYTTEEAEAEAEEEAAPVSEQKPSRTALNISRDTQGIRSEDLRAEFVDIFYEVKPNVVLIDEVMSILSTEGINNARELYFNRGSRITADQRVLLGFILMKTHDDEAQAVRSTNPELSDKHYDMAVDIGLELDEINREYGRAVQANAIMWRSVLATPAGAERFMRKIVNRYADSVMQRQDVKDLVLGYRRITEGAAGEVVNEPYIQQRIANVLEMISSEREKELTGYLANDEKMKVAQETLSSEETEIPAGISLATEQSEELTLDEKLGMFARYGMGLIIKGRIRTLNEFSKAMTENIPDPNLPQYMGRIYNDAKIRAMDRIARGARKATKAETKREKAGGRDVARQVNAVLREWATGSLTAEPRTIIDRLAQLGVSEARATKLMDATRTRFAERTVKRRADFLKKFTTGRKIDPETQKAYKNITELASRDDLTDENVRDAIVTAFDLPDPKSERIRTRVAKLAKAIKDAPEGFKKDDEVRKMLDFIRTEMPIAKMDVVWSLWYANILSGYQTAERNMAGNLFNLISTLTASIIVEPRNAPVALWGFVKGVGSGMRAAYNVMKTGSFPIRDEKYEQSQVLEFFPFRGMMKVLSNWKYVLRSLQAVDMLFYKAGQEARAMMLAADIARTESETPADKVWERAAELTGLSKDVQAKYRAIAIAEKFRGNEIELRVQELAERNRPEEITTEATDYARRVTYNYQPEGQLGILAKGISEVSKSVPMLRLAVPFTRIVANVGNTTIDYTPWGFVRAIRGMRDLKGKLTPMTGHRRATTMAKAMMGTIGMVSAYMADKMQGDDDDEDKKTFAIYGSGPSELNKAYQLRQTGWRPYSFKFGKRYFDYRLTPLAIPFAIIGSIRDAERWHKLDEKSKWQRASYATLKSGSVIFDMSFLSGINQVMTMLQSGTSESSGRKLQNYLIRNASSAVPALFKQIDRTFDSQIHDNATIQEALLRELPVASRLVRPKLNLLGEPVPQLTGPLSIFISDKQSDPVWRFIANKEVFISKPPKSTTVGRGRRKRMMTEEEYYTYIQTSGKMIRNMLERTHTKLEKIKDRDRIEKIVDKAVIKIRSKVKRKIYIDSVRARRRSSAI